MGFRRFRKVTLRIDLLKTGALDWCGEKNRYFLIPTPGACWTVGDRWNTTVRLADAERDSLTQSAKGRTSI